MEWTNQLLGEWTVPDPEDEFIYKQVIRLMYLTELYDRSLTDVRNRYGDADVNVSREVYDKSREYSKELHTLSIQEIVREGYDCSWGKFRDVQRKTHMSFDSLKFVYEGLWK